MFHRFNGIVAEPTQTNLQKALDRNLEISIPWIGSQKIIMGALRLLKLIQSQQVRKICASLTDYMKGMQREKKKLFGS